MWMRLRGVLVELAEACCVGLFAYGGIVGSKPGWMRVGYGAVAGALAVFFYVRRSMRQRKQLYEENLAAFTQHRPEPGGAALLTLTAVGQDGGVTVTMQINASQLDPTTTAMILDAARERIEYEIRAQSAPLN